MRRSAFASLVLVLAPVAAAQCVLVNAGGLPYHQEISDGFKIHRLVACGDVDGDGFDDLAIGEPLSVIVQGPGAVWIVSAVDGSIVSRLPDPSANASGVGRTVANVGDLTGDGHPELATGFADSVSAPLGAVGIFRTDTSTPTLIRILQEPSWRYNKNGIAPAGDITGDSIPDVLVGALLGSDSTIARVDLRDGATGALVRSFLPASASEGFTNTSQFGIAIAGNADVDGDGTPDVAIGSPLQSNPFGSGKGAVKVYSGATGVLIRSILPSQLQSGFGRDVEFVGDVDQDGVSDLVVGGDGKLSSNGVGDHSVTLVSGATGQVIRGHGPAFYGSTLTGAVRAVGDMNADGVPDYAATNHDVASTTGVPLAIVWSGADGSRLLTSTLLPSLGQAGLEYGELAAIDDRNGDGKPELALLAAKGTTPKQGRLQVLTLPAGRVFAAEAGDGCQQESPLNYDTTAILFAGCVEAGGTFRVIERSANIWNAPKPLFLVLSATLGSTPIDGHCALHVGLPVFILPAGQTDSDFPATLPPTIGPFQIHVESVHASGAGYATSGATTLIIE